MTGSYSFSIDRTWDDRPLGDDERCSVRLQADGQRLQIEIDAPFHDDPRPPVPAGRFDGLWNFEAVELFLVSDHGYVELEFGPHGHFLALELKPVRRRQREVVPMEFTTSGVELREPLWIVGETRRRWHGAARIETGELPGSIVSANAFALHGNGAMRRYLVAHPLHDPGDREPDFHRVEGFPSLESFVSGASGGS